MGFRDEDERLESDDADKVGYGRPPKHSRFRKGQSGNPRGKPRGTQNSATLLKKALLESVLVKQNGRESKTTKLRVIATRLVNQAMQGDYSSIRLLLRYAGLDRQLDEPKGEKRGLSAETAALIRGALLGDSYKPEILDERKSKNETSPACADTETKPRPGENHQRTYEVGYGKPPTHTRFQKGRSGNPAGRPRAPRSFRMLILQRLDEEVSIAENGREQTMSRLQVIFKRIVNKAALGDSRFQALLLEYAPALDVNLGQRRRLPKNAQEMVRKALFGG